jgi:hypothetical protein
LYNGEKSKQREEDWENALHIFLAFQSSSSVPAVFVRASLAQHACRECSEVDEKLTVRIKAGFDRLKPGMLDWARDPLHQLV